MTTNQSAITPPTVGLDISPTSLSRLEGQYRLVQDYEIVAIAKALDISVEELLGKKRNN
jgi:hypothetical protein